MPASLFDVKSLNGVQQYVINVTVDVTISHCSFVFKKLV